jgi:hypothetical protein
VLGARGGGAGDPDVRAGRAAAAAAAGGKKKTPLNVLKELMASMEESDYGSYGMWGDLKEDTPTGAAAARAPGTSNRSGGGTAEQGRQAEDDAATDQGAPPPPAAAVAAGVSGRWANEDLVARDVAAAVAANPAFGGRRARAAARAAAAQAGGGDTAGGDAAARAAGGQERGGLDQAARQEAPGAARPQWAVAVPPDPAEDLTLEEPPPGTEGAEDFVAKALRTAYRLAAIAGFGMALAYASVVPPGAMLGGGPTAAASLAGALAGAGSAAESGLVPFGVTHALGRGLAAGRAGRLFRRKYNQNCALLLAAAAPSVLFSWMVFDARTMSFHAFVRVAFDAMTLGFAAAFAAEVAQATAYRAAALAW